VNDATRRATRTLLQTLPGGFLVTGWNLFTPPHMHLNAEQAAWIVVVLTALSSFAMNMLETASGHAVLKTQEEQSIAREGR
jgi:hypothetical protein